MKPDDARVFEFDFEADFEDAFDPLADEPENDWEDEGTDADDVEAPEFTPAGASNLEQPEAPVERPRDNRPAEERLAELMEEMGLRRHVLLNILDSCRSPRRAVEVNEEVSQLRATNYSVYSGADLTSLLERAGGLERVQESGEAYSQVEIAAEVVEEDGVAYLEPARAPEVYWLTTPAGLAALEKDDSLNQTMAMLEEEPAYLPVYKRVLKMCCEQEDGIAIKAVSDAVDADPLLQSPRRFAAYFVERLERCGALAWRGAWTPTKAAFEALASLDGVDDGAGE